MTTLPALLLLALLLLARHHGHVLRRHERDAAAWRAALRLAHAQILAAPPALPPRHGLRLKGRRVP